MPASRLNRLADLAALRDALERDAADRERREREAARAKVEAALAKVEAAREVDVFRAAVGAVEPLKVAARVQHRSPKPEPVAHQHRADEAAALAASFSDGVDPDFVLECDDDLSWCRDGIGPEIVRKLRRGHWIIQAELDLHGDRTEQARERVAEFLRLTVKRQLRCVRIVHGKGLGSAGGQPVLKGKVKRWLMQKDEVIGFCHAREHDGGGGALLVLLRPS